MTPKNLLQAFRTPRRIALLAATALVAVAAPASALLGLPVALPGIDQRVDTPAGSIDAAASGQGASACIDLGTPALPPLPAVPALPSLPSLPTLPVPVAIPALPSVPAVPAPSAQAKACASAGLDGASASLDADAAGSRVGTGIDAQTPVPVSAVEGIAAEAQGLASETSGESVGFFEGLMDTLFGWI